MSSLNKSPDAFRTISEVAEDLDLPQHVLRFWETRFAQIKPLKRGGGRRYYRPDDVELLKGIRHLLYGQGYTIKGVQRILREEGPRHVMQAWQETSDPAVLHEDASERELQPASGLPRDVLSDEEPAQPEPSGTGGLGIVNRLMGEKQPAAEVNPVRGSVSKDDVRRLQSTLFELLECKRVLDQAR